MHMHVDDRRRKLSVLGCSYYRQDDDEEESGNSLQVTTSRIPIVAQESHIRAGARYSAWRFAVLARMSPISTSREAILTTRRS
jgi:hypothetical protein